MANNAIRCSECGGTQIQIIGHGVGRCLNCSATVLVSEVEDAEIVSLLNQAYLYRKSFDFDMAIKTYELIIEKEPQNAAAFEGLLLSKYGIEYVDDVRLGKKVPTCHRINFQSALLDPAYKELINLIPEDLKLSMDNRVREIDRLTQAIKERLKDEQEYDVFISYKAGTEDEFIAREIYDELTKRGYLVFFAEKSLENRLGEMYEPIIYKALHSAKVFALVGSSKANINSVWVRNEWSRFIERIKDSTDSVKTSAFIPVFKGMSPYDFPTIRGRALQGVDAGKIGYYMVVADGVDRLISKNSLKKVQAERDALAEKARLLEIEQKEMRLKDEAEKIRLARVQAETERIRFEQAERVRNAEKAKAEQNSFDPFDAAEREIKAREKAKQGNHYNSQHNFNDKATNNANKNTGADGNAIGDALKNVGKVVATTFVDVKNRVVGAFSSTVGSSNVERERTAETRQQASGNTNRERQQETKENRAKIQREKAILNQERAAEKAKAKREEAERVRAEEEAEAKKNKLGLFYFIRLTAFILIGVGMCTSLEMLGGAVRSGGVGAEKLGITSLFGVWLVVQSLSVGAFALFGSVHCMLTTAKRGKRLNNAVIIVMVSIALIMLIVALNP